MATIDKSLAILGLPGEGTSIGEAVKAYRLEDGRWIWIVGIFRWFIVDYRS